MVVVEEVVVEDEEVPAELVAFAHRLADAAAEIIAPLFRSAALNSPGAVRHPADRCARHGGCRMAGAGVDGRWKTRAAARGWTQ